jgi:negative regulator of flagellin synthesis FlgM
MIDGIRNGGMNPFISSSAARAASVREAAADPSQPVRASSGASAVKPGLGALVAALAKAPPVDETRVASLKAAMAEGSYRIDPDAIAAAMLRLDRGRP